MEDTRLRQLESHYKLRVKTGCETCRIRRVKCDETKPACLRCTKTGRKCEGYDRHEKKRKGEHAVAASYRNSSFLVVPQKPRQTSLPRSPTQALSADPLEVRSFQYFQAHTLPNWTEFFDSELWGRKILQLSHAEPAIKHGLLALSVMHERYERGSPVYTDDRNDFAFVQYAQAIKHSNKLLEAHADTNDDVEMVLTACIIFICYENLAGNLKTAAMHMKNGMRILDQHKRAGSVRSPESLGAIANVLSRFDLQAMSYSDNASPYNYLVDVAPEIPVIPDTYTNNSAARNDLVCLMRGTMWISGTLDTDFTASEHPTWQGLYADLMVAYEEWEKKFAEYQLSITSKDLLNPRLHAGNTLLIMSAALVRIFLGSMGGFRSEMSWDAFMDDFQTIIDLAETLPAFKPQPSSSSTPTPTRPPSPAAPHPGSCKSRVLATMAMPKNRPIAPHPRYTSPSPPPGQSTFVFAQHPSPAPAPPRPAPLAPDTSSPTAASFSPSFELSPIVPLFVVACRCRDPVLRRRAIALLLRSRRREGAWDSLGAAMVALQVMKKEEGLPNDAVRGDEGLLAYDPHVRTAHDVPESMRVKDIFVHLKAREGKLELSYSTSQGMHDGLEVVYESSGDGRMPLPLR